MRESSVEGDYDNNVHGNNILVAASWHIVHRTLNDKEDGPTRWPVTLREIRESLALIKFLSNVLLLPPSPRRKSGDVPSIT